MGLDEIFRPLLLTGSIATYKKLNAIVKQILKWK